MDEERLAEEMTPLQMEEAGRRLIEIANERKAKHKAEVTAQINELAAGAGLTVTVHEVKPVKTVSPVTHKDPANPKNVWRGRGMKPKWLTAYLAQGRTVEEFAV